MRHRKSGRSLSRNWEHRKAMFRNMAKSLVTHEKIKTTLPKAKELSKVADRLVTLALRGDLSAKREAYKVLGNHRLVKRLFDDIAPRFEKRSGGYTRVVKYAKPRVGDSASLALIEFTYKTSDGPEPGKTGPAKDRPQIKSTPSAAHSAGSETAVQEKDSPALPDEEKQTEPKVQPRETEESTTAPDEADDQVQEDKSEESRPHGTGEDPGRTK